MLQCVQGYALEFFDFPSEDNWPPTFPSLSRDQEAVLDQEIQQLLDEEAIEHAQDRQGFFSPMFVISKKDGGWRPIINLKRLNSYWEVSCFKMEGIGDLKDILQEKDFMGKIDLKDAYLTVPVCRRHRNFLKFR